MGNVVSKNQILTKSRSDTELLKKKLDDLERPLILKHHRLTSLAELTFGINLARNVIQMMPDPPIEVETSSSDDGPCNYDDTTSWNSSGIH